MKSSGMIFGYLQRIGKALMLPIATLPAAGLLLRFGQSDLLDIPFIAASGQAIFTNIPIIFAIGIAAGLSRDNSAAAALAGAIGYFVLVNCSTTIDASINMSVFAGIIAGITAGELYNRFYKINLPEWLSFFGGRRFVPIITALACLLLGILMGYIWPYCQSGIDQFGLSIQDSGAAGAGIYGFFNRLLIPFGLHHILNSYFWFMLGSFTTPEGAIVHGDLNRFFVGDPNAGMYMSGFFPFLMFGYPAAVLAMYLCAKKDKRKAVAGMFISIGLTAFLTGIGEPIDFLYLFIAPVLYLIHSLLVGLSLLITNLLGIKLGFTFSAGFIDYILNFNIATKPLLVIPVGIVFGFIYFFLFRFFILKFNLKTPGREDNDGIVSEQQFDSGISHNNTNQRAKLILAALGGQDNIIDLGACITRLRVIVKDKNKVDSAALKSLGAAGVIVLENNIQAIFGTKAEMIRDEIAKEINP